jgi:hypothetical protein
VLFVFVSRKEEKVPNRPHVLFVGMASERELRDCVKKLNPKVVKDSLKSWGLAIPVEHKDMIDAYVNQVKSDAIAKFAINVPSSLASKIESVVGLSEGQRLTDRIQQLGLQKIQTQSFSFLFFLFFFFFTNIRSFFRSLFHRPQQVLAEIGHFDHFETR